MFNRILGLIFILFAIGAEAQQYIESHFNQKNGLPQNSVNDLFWDTTGYLWLTTEDGLVRFDGHSFHTFTINNSPIFTNDRFRWILKNMDGRVLTSSVDGNVFELRGNQPIPYLSVETPYQKYTGLLPSKPILTNLLTFRQVQFQKNNWRYFPTQFGIDNQDLYVLGNSQLYKLSNLLPIDSVPIKKNIQFLFNIGKYLYIADSNHLFYVNTQLKQFIPVSFNTPFTPVGSCSFYPQVNSEKLCVVNNNKLFVWSIQNSPTQINCDYKIDLNSIPREQISNICYNEHSNIFAVGSFINGLYLFKPRILKTRTPFVTDIRRGYYSNVPLNDSSVLTSYGDLITPNTITESTFDLLNSNQQLLHADRHNRIWSSRGDTMFYQVYNQAKMAIPLPYREYIRTFYAKGDTIIVFTTKHVLLLKDTSIIYKAELWLNHTPCLIDSWTGILFSNNKWLASRPDGIYELLLKQKAQLNKIFNYKHIRFLTQVKGIIIGGTYGNGWFAITNGQLVRLPIDPKNYLNKVHSVVYDEEDKLFISTNNGLFLTTLTELVNRISDTTYKMYFQYFDDTDGIENVEFNGGCYPPATRLKNGNIYFANMAGLIEVTPDKLTIANKHSVYIDQIEADNSVIPLSDTIDISSQTEKISISLSVVYWNNPYNIQLEYKLEGFNKNWIKIGSDLPIITFTNLPSGEYNLIIRSKTGFNSASSSELIIHIHKEPRFYESLWFVLVIIVLILLMVYLVNRIVNKQLLYRNTQLEKRVQERTSELQNANQQLIKSEQELIQSVNVKNKLISIISHDIVTPLRFISLVSKEYKSNHKDSTQSEIIREIHHTSIRLHDNAQNILNWVRYQNNLIKVTKTSIAPYVLVEEITELFREVAANRKNTIINNVDMDDIIVSDRNILIIILQNIISNAVKYTHSSHIIIESTKVNNQYLISISDDGNGISENNLKRIEAIKAKAKTNMFDDSADGTGLGYVIIFELIELLGADLTIQSTQNKGTKISIILR